MGQFTVYRNEDKDSSETYPYFIDVQNALLDDLNTRLVIPLSKYTSLNNQAVEKLCPIIEIDDEKYVLLTNQMATVPVLILKNEICQLENYRYEIVNAIDFLITGI
ncbi:MAG: CcdB family protein [Gammaproteobacteria bacterium]|nr:CcdB family protein [Gammaproteobacteria bacterium]